jgi:glycerophosphoryl diester phosphodiesterase
MPSDLRARRGPRPGALAALLLALCAACEPRGEVLHPQFAGGGDLGCAPAPSSCAAPAGVTLLRADVLSKLEGMFGVSRGSGRFGSTIAVHAARDTLSLFTNAHDNYAILHAGCLNGGTRLELEGYWRYASQSDTGLVRLTVAPPALALALCTGGPLPIPAPQVQLVGALGVGEGALKEGLDFRFGRPLVNTAGRFWVAAHHGACQTIDDCGASENSLPSLRMVESFGASDVEVDVRLTADGVPVLFHDDNFGPRLATGVYCHGPVEKFTLADIRALCKLKYGEDVPTLDEALNTVIRDTGLAGLWLDVKVGAAIMPVLNALGPYRALGKQLDRNVDIVIGLGEKDVLDAYLSSPVPAGTHCLVELDPSDVRRAGCQFWGPRWTRGPMVPDVQALQAENRAVMYWTIDDTSYVDLYLRQAKPNGVLTDRPGMVFHRFQTLGRFPPDRIP